MATVRINHDWRMNLNASAGTATEAVDVADASYGSLFPTLIAGTWGTAVVDVQGSADGVVWSNIVADVEDGVVERAIDLRGLAQVRLRLSTAEGTHGEAKFAFFADDAVYPEAVGPTGPAGADGADGADGAPAPVAIVLVPLAVEPPASSPASLAFRNSHPILRFDVGDAAVFTAVLPAHYAGNGLEVSLLFAAESATTGNVAWEVSIERLTTAAQDMDSDGFATAVGAGDTAVPGTSGQLAAATVSLDDGAEMDSTAAGDLFRIKVARVAASGSEASAGADLRAVIISEP